MRKTSRAYTNTFFYFMYINYLNYYIFYTYKLYYLLTLIATYKQGNAKLNTSISL